MESSERLLLLRIVLRRASNIDSNSFRGSLLFAEDLKIFLVLHCSHSLFRLRSNVPWHGWSLYLYIRSEDKGTAVLLKPTRLVSIKSTEKWTRTNGYMLSIRNSFGVIEHLKKGTLVTVMLSKTSKLLFHLTLRVPWQKADLNGKYRRPITSF